MSLPANQFSLERCARPNIWSLSPYRCARDEFPDDGKTVLLDANENAYGPSIDIGSQGYDTNIRQMKLHRYPDPHQLALKQVICDLRNVNNRNLLQLTPSNLFLGTGSDEAIDNLIRCFCRPEHDKILTCPPTYGVYSVAAAVNDVEIIKVNLDLETFELNVDAVMDALTSNPNIKLLFLCSPGNPTAKLLSKFSIGKILRHPTWNGIVVVDEAYVDFSPAGSSCTDMVLQRPNLVVLQTLSKGFGLAGIRLGFAICPSPIAALLNRMKAPYNVSQLTSQMALAAFESSGLEIFNRNLEHILQQRVRMLEALPKITGVGRIRGGTESNFILFEIKDMETGKPSNDMALKVYQELATEGAVIVRYRGTDPGCEGCLRVTVGTKAENEKFLSKLSALLQRN